MDSYKSAADMASVNMNSLLLARALQVATSSTKLTMVNCELILERGIFEASVHVVISKTINQHVLEYDEIIKCNCIHSVLDFPLFIGLSSTSCFA